MLRGKRGGEERLAADTVLDTFSSSFAVSLVIEAAISGPGGLTFTGTGGLTFRGSSPNTYLGTTRVHGNVLLLSKPDGVTAIPGPVIVGDGVGGPLTSHLDLFSDHMIADTASLTVNQDGLFNLGAGNVVETIGSLTPRALRSKPERRHCRGPAPGVQ